MDAEQFRARYRIKTVRDIRDDSCLSVAEAVDKGVIDLSRGQYVNRGTGDRVTVPEAIQQGLIVQLTPMERIAELRQGSTEGRQRRQSSFARLQRNGTAADDSSTNTTSAEADEEASKRPQRSFSLRDTPSSTRTRRQPRTQSVVGCFYGLIVFTVKPRSVQYKIDQAVDCRTNESVSFTEAKEKGIIDTEAQMYINNENSECMPFINAIQQNLLSIELLPDTAEEEGEHDEPYVVYGVMDLLDQRRMTFKEALDNNLLIIQPPLYRDTLNHLDMDLFDAINEKLVVAKAIEGSSYDLYDNMISEENRIETERIVEVLKYHES